MSGATTSDEVQSLLEFADHPSSPAALRRHLPRLRAEAVRAAPRAFERFVALAGGILPHLPTVTPETELYRAQTLSTFLRHCARPEWRDIDPEAVRRYIEQEEPDPDRFLTDALDRLRTVFPWDHSWLIEAEIPLRDKTGAELVALLELQQQEPPLVLCFLPLGRLVQSGVRIRQPTAADAALGGHEYWKEGLLPAGREFVDLNVSGAAIEEVLWRP